TATCPGCDSRQMRSALPSLLTWSQSTWFPTAYDVTADGRRFVLNVPPEDPGPPITVVLNWMAVAKKSGEGGTLPVAMGARAPVPERPKHWSEIGGRGGAMELLAHQAGARRSTCEPSGHLSFFNRPTTAPAGSWNEACRARNGGRERDVHRYAATARRPVHR